MSTIQPTAGRFVPNGSLNRHTAVNAPGLGIPGGIKQYQPGGTAGWATINLDLSGYGPLDDISGAIQNAFNTYQHGSKRIVIPEGDWTCNQTNFGSLISGLYRGNIIFSGSGMGRTILTKRSGPYAMFYVGGGSTWGSLPEGPGSSGIVVSGDLNQGQSSLIVSAGDRSTWGMLVGTKIQFYWENMTDHDAIVAGATPTWAFRAQPYIRCQQAKVTGISGDTVTFYPPIQHQPPVGLDCRLYTGFRTEAAERIGFENLTMRTAPEYHDLVTNFDNSTFFVYFNDFSEFWLLNVEISVNSGINFALNLSNVTRFEVRGCYIHGVAGLGNNHSLVLLGHAYAGLFEDNIMHDGSPTVEINSSAGILFHGNYIQGEFNTNHGAMNFGIVCIRNIIEFEKCDGYHGPCDSITMIGNWLYGIGMAKRRFSFKANSYGNVISSPFNTNGFDFINGFGIPYIGGSDPLLNTKPHSEFFADNFPVDWPYGPDRFVKMLTRETENVGIWEAQSPMYVSNAGNMGYCMLEGVDGTYLAGGYGGSPPLQVLTETTWRSPLLNGGVLPAEGSLHKLISPGPEGYPQHNDDVWNTHDFRANILWSTIISNFPAQPIGSDVIFEPMGYTSPPAGDGIDEIDWGSHPWFANGGQQYGFIDRSNHTGLTHRDIPAGRRFTDGTIFSTSTQVATPSFSPSPAPTTGVSVTISCTTADAIIHYTLDGSTPTAASPVYSSPISITTTTTLKAFAVKSGLTDSAIRSGFYEIGSLPTVPGAMTLPTVTQTTIQVDWTHNLSNVTGFEIWHGSASGVLTLLNTVGLVNTFTHTGLSPNTPHYYQVRAVNAFGVSAFTAEQGRSTLGPNITVFDFPGNPTTNQVHVIGVRSWKWNGTGWRQI